MRIIKSIKPTGKMGNTNALLADQGYTYNQAGLSYNEAGVMYGGKYGSDVYKISGLITNRKPTNIISIIK